MKVLVLGSPRFICARAVEELLAARCEVMLMTKWRIDEERFRGVNVLEGENAEMGKRLDEVRAFGPDAHDEAEARLLRRQLDPIVASYAIGSSGNVYKAHGRVHGTEPGPPYEDCPIREDGALRSMSLGDEAESDRLAVEKVFLDGQRPSTILRLPPTYGPEDYARRFYPLLVRMMDRRPTMLLGESQADWKWTHGYVDNVAHAVALAAQRPAEKAEVYNVGEQTVPSMKERIENLAMVADWEGTVLVVPDNRLPKHMQVTGDFAQDLIYDTAKIRHDLGFKEVADYYEGLHLALDWYAANPPPGMAKRKFDYSEEDAIARKFARRDAR